MATTDDPVEVAKAELYQARLARRATAEAARARALSGSRTARAALADRWSPLKADPRYPERHPAPPPAPGGAYAALYLTTY